MENRQFVAEMWKMGASIVENAWKTAGFTRSFPYAFHTHSITASTQEEKIRKSFFSHGKPCGKCYKTMYFRTLSHVSTEMKTAKLENITLYKSIFSVDFIR